MFTFDLDTEALFDERAQQFTNAWGIPAPIVARVRAAVNDPWSSSRGGWTVEWAREAARAEADGQWLLAALCWGAAKFPTIATSERGHAYQRQLAAYERAVPTFPVSFRRQKFTVDGPNGKTTVAAHLFPRRHPRRKGVIVLCGGVDTWKVELHRPAVRMARATGFTVVALDNPGTGETTAPITPDADKIIAETIRAVAHTAGGGPVGMVGVSFAGLWAAKLALDGWIDAAVNLGGPVGAEVVSNVLALPNGMPGILAHAAHLQQLPTREEFADLVGPFSLGRQGYFARPATAPVLAVNGENDQFIPLADTTVFAGIPKCEAWVVRNATHCAAEKITTIMPAALTWLIARMTDQPRDKAKAMLLKLIAAASLRRQLG